MGKYGPENKKAQTRRKLQLREPLVLNKDKTPGKRVMVADLTPHALPMHPLCGGTGIKRGTTNVTCKCAMKRFFKAHPEIILDATGAAWWPAKEEKADGRTDGGTEGTTDGGAGSTGAVRSSGRLSTSSSRPATPDESPAAWLPRSGAGS